MIMDVIVPVFVFYWSTQPLLSRPHPVYLVIIIIIIIICFILHPSQMQTLIISPFRWIRQGERASWEGWMNGGGGGGILMWEKLPGCVFCFRMERERVPGSIMDLAKLHFNAFSGKHSKVLSDPLPALLAKPHTHTHTNSPTSLCLSLAPHALALPLPAIPAEYESSWDVRLTAWTCHQVVESTG